MPYGDSSWILRTLSPEYGLLSFLVKGAKKKESKFFSVIDPFSESHAVFRFSEGRDLHFLQEASLSDWHGEMRKNLVSLAEAEVLAEIILRYSSQGFPLESEFALFHEMLCRLDKKETSLLSSFLLRLCALWGVEFNVKNCFKCGKELTSPPANFQEESGAVFCESCAKVKALGRRAEYLKDLYRVSQGKAPFQAELVEMGLLHYFKMHLGTRGELRSVSWLKEVRKLCGL